MTEFHIGLLPNRSVEEVVRFIVTAEELGFGGAWVADSQSIFRDAFTVLSVAAIRTERIKLATGVSNPVTRVPAVLAGSFATLDEISDGRAILGMGVGESAVHTIGLKPARLARMREVSEAARDLIRGRTVRIDEVELTMPWSAREIPVYVAASGPRSLEMAGEYADGVLFQVGSRPEMVKYAIDHVHTGARRANREPDEVKLLARLACSTDADRERARDQVGGYVTAAAGTVFTSIPAEVIPADLAADIARMKEIYNYLEHGSQTAEHRALITDRIIDAISISGTPEEAIPRFRQLIDLGVDGFVTPFATDDPVASMRSMAEDVIPHVAG